MKTVALQITDFQGAVSLYTKISTSQFFCTISFITIICNQQLCEGIQKILYEPLQKYYKKPVWFVAN